MKRISKSNDFSIHLKQRETTCVADMIFRFRHEEPKSRAVRDAMRRNGDLPVSMWWNNGHRNDDVSQISPYNIKTKTFTTERDGR